MPNPLAKLDAIRIGSPRPVLVLHTDGVRLCAALVRPGGGAGAIAAAATSLEPDPRTALGEVLDGLKTQGVRRPPRRAVLVSASALPALVELPVDPDHPRPRDQMHELVRWELESLFSEQAGRWSIGALLMARGDIDAAGRRAVALAQARPPDEREDEDDWAPAGPKRARFGELAVALGLVGQGQVDACLALQERLFQGDDELVCGWRAQDDLPDEREEADGRYPWLAAAVPEGERATWVRTCERHGIFLAAIYPRLGSRFAAQGPGPGDETLYLELQAEHLLVLRGRPGGLSALRLVRTRDGLIDDEVLAQVAREGLAAGAERFLLLGTEATGAPLATRLAQHFAGEAQVVTPPAGHPALPVWVADELRAAAADTQALARSGTLVAIEAQPPRPPLWRRRELWPYAAAALVILSVLGNDLRMRIGAELNARELARLDAEYTEAMRLKTLSNQMAAQSRQIEQELAQEKGAVADLARQIQGLTYLDERQVLLPRLLERIASVINDEMLVTRLKVPTKPGEQIYLLGWALTNTAGQLFVSTLNNAQGDPRVRVASSRIAAAPGPMGISGFAVEVWLSLNQDPAS